MEDGFVVPGQFSQQRQGDDRLAAAGASGDHQHPLVVTLLRPFHLMHDHVHRQLLFTEQHELFPLPDLIGGDLEKLGGGGDRRAEQSIRSLGTGSFPTQILAQKIMEAAA